MSFAREEKKINEPMVFYPPPGYYETDNKVSLKPAPSFGRSERFNRNEVNNYPGPASYSNNHKQQVRKRLIEQSQRRDIKASESGGSNIKISSIPSIPKKSATRVYEQLAPGILILHEEQYENASIGPGSYNVTDKLLHPKQVAHRIPPQHKKRVREDEEIEVNVPTIAEQIRNQRRLMYKQNLIKSSTVNKSQISPSDLCLEVIILREKLLRSDQNPPPGYYHNPGNSTFKTPQQDQRPVESQCLGGKEKRFLQLISKIEVGPGTYQMEEDPSHKGGFIPKSPRKIGVQYNEKPGPGAYINEKPKVKQDSKASYPPIFGSGCSRFMSAPKTLQSAPGPGAYKIDKKKGKKQKYIKIKRQLLEPSRGEPVSQPVLGIQGDLSQVSHYESQKQRKLYQFQKNSSNFASKIQRFENDRSFQDGVGPGVYDISSEFASKTFNKKNDGYVGNRGVRFDESQIRPKIGPGTYNPAYQTVKQRKIANVFL